ncbi:hypothetical protein SAMN04487981_12963 [Streptomyces sp. cf386]|uniref:hypothetical protein n=1 Tax=Streptomyces sp. cf386 TaxID=1761904 RepID=UPI0008855D0C|nr:hypothetical protein [Streptomyces sp. cf386]SDP62592.1 hypothetical protein SAMN04487981_12963 [Streptomyces sp. cf386]
MLLGAVAARGRVLAGLRRDGEENSTAELQARVAVRQAVRDAWAEGIEHTVQLSVLAEAGLADDAALAAAGWELVLLAAIDRSQGWGRLQEGRRHVTTVGPGAGCWPVPGSGGYTNHR